MVDGKPAVTVVIPTYNWSTALRCAIRSVLLQTRQDFELLVVGDGCTDDSADVVASFNDPRIRWHNLERNYGSQWVANNYANEHARGDWIAYLGHDDVWYPTHLEAVLRAAEREGADIVTSTMILYWPEATGGRGIAGIFASGAFRDGDFVPPSAFAHARRVYGGAVCWRDPDTVVAPTDAAFLDAVAASGCRFAATGELTCFKFNAAWRRDVYRTRPAHEQERMLERIESGTDFRQEELYRVLEAVVAGRFAPIVAPPVKGIKAGEYVARNRRHKGSDPRFAPDTLVRITKRTRFGMEQQAMPFEWCELEQSEQGSFRWSGPSSVATIDLPVRLDRDLRVRVRVIMILQPELAGQIKLSLHGHPLDVSIARQGRGYVIETIVRQADGDPARDFGITIDTGSVARPCDLGMGPDTRWLGVAVTGVELEPLG
jgi:hypothetical protein